MQSPKQAGNCITAASQLKKKKQKTKKKKERKKRKESLKANSIILLQLSTYGKFCFFIPHTHLCKYVGIYFFNEDLNFLFLIKIN